MTDTAAAPATSRSSGICSICLESNEDNGCANCRPECADCCGCYTWETQVDLRIEHNLPYTAKPLDRQVKWNVADPITHEVVDTAGVVVGAIKRSDYVTVADLTTTAIGLANKHMAFLP